MSEEFYALIPDPTKNDQIRAKIVDYFSAKGCAIVRDEGRCFAVALQDRLSTAWDADLTVCIDSHIYVAFHSVDWKTLQSTLAGIAHVVEPVCTPLRWSDVGDEPEEAECMQ